MVFATLIVAALIFSNPALAPPYDRAPHFVHSYTLPLGAYPQSIVTGADGALWFSTYPRLANHQPIDLGVGRITTDGKLSFVLIGQGTYDVTAGPDGRVWFTNPYLHPYDVGAVSMNDAVVHYSVPSDGSPESISTGPNGHLWFTSFGGTPDILQMDVGGKVDSIFHSIGSAAVKIAPGAAGNMWFDGAGNPNLVGRIGPRHGKVERPIGGPSYIPGPLALGRDGRMWICDGSFVAAVAPDFTVVRYPMPFQDSGADGITAGPDGNMWVTDFQHGALARVTMSGTITEFKIPVANAGPFGITVGPDGNLWYTEIDSQTDVATIGSFKP